MLKEELGRQTVAGGKSPILLTLSLRASSLLLSSFHSWQEQCVGVAQETSS